MKVVERVVEASIRRDSVDLRQMVEVEHGGLEVISLKNMDYSELVADSVAVDVASASIYLGGNYIGIAGLSVVSPSGLTVYPPIASESYSGPPFVSSLRRVAQSTAGVTDRYVELGIPYEVDPYIDPFILESDVRLALELYGLSTAASAGSRYVFVDGPLIPTVRPYLRPGYWTDELTLFQSKRAHCIDRALNDGSVVIGFVKRVGAEAPKVGVRQGANPLAVGPVIVRAEPKICFFYILVGWSGYSYTMGRVEIPCAAADRLGPSRLSDLLSMVYSSCSSLAIPVPYNLYVADKVSKSLVKKLVDLVELTARTKGVLAVIPGEHPYG